MQKLSKKMDKSSSPLEDLHSKAEKISSSFLRGRVQDYIDASIVLMQSLREKLPSLEEDVDYYGKMACQVDLILSLSTLSRQASVDDINTNKIIRTAVEKELNDFGQHRDDVFVLEPAFGGWQTKVRSSFGVRMEGWLKRLTNISFLRRGGAKQSLGDLASEAQIYENEGQWDKVSVICQAILRQDPHNIEALRGWARASLRLSDVALGVTCLRQAKKLAPDNVRVLGDLGAALAELQSLEEASATFQEALRLKPEDIECLSGLAMVRQLQDNPDDALKHLDRALALAPWSPDVLARLGIYHHFYYNLKLATDYYAKSLKIMPHNLLALNNYAMLLGQQRKTSDALVYFERALSQDPHNASVLFAKSIVLLSTGDFTKGWPLYEYGLKPGLMRKPTFAENKPIWDGDPAPKKKLLIITEQGLGDAIQFVRYAALCKEKVGSVYVLCPPSLKRIFEQCPFIDKVFSDIANAGFDMQISMMSLPALFGTTDKTIPATVPYLFVPQEMIEKAKRKVAQGKEGMKIGLVWMGSSFGGSVAGKLTALRRNVHLEKLLPLLVCEPVTFVNLQMGDGAQHIDELGVRDRFIDVMSDVTDILDTAAIIENLDLVITVDTSVAHLAGALGKPVWVLSRYDACWRWLYNKVENPWYPTARVFGQPVPGDWDSVVSEVKTALQELISKR